MIRLAQPLAPGQSAWRRSAPSRQAQGPVPRPVLPGSCGVGSPRAVGGAGDGKGRLIFLYSHHALNVCLIRGELLQNRGQRFGEASLIDHVVLLMEQHDDTVVCMQINPTVEWHLLSPQSGD